MTEQTPNKADLLLPLTMAAMSNSYDNEETADEDGFPDDSPQKKSNPTKKNTRCLAYYSTNASYPLTWQPLSLEQNSEASLKNASKQSSTRLKRIQT